MWGSTYDKPRTELKWVGDPKPKTDSRPTQEKPLVLLETYVKVTPTSPEVYSNSNYLSLKRQSGDRVRLFLSPHTSCPVEGMSERTGRDSHTRLYSEPLRPSCSGHSGGFTGVPTSTFGHTGVYSHAESTLRRTPTCGRSHVEAHPQPPRIRTHGTHSREDRHRAQTDSHRHHDTHPFRETQRLGTPTSQLVDVQR